jgi:hypothetical protein
MIVKLDSIYSERNKVRLEGVLRGAYYMKESYNLNSSDYNTYKDIRRAPILVEDCEKDGDNECTEYSSEDHTEDPEKVTKIYKILDGHSTYENAKKAGWPNIYVVKIQSKDVEQAQKFLNDKKKSSEQQLADFEAPLLDPDKKSVGGYHRYKYKSRRYKKNKHYSKKNKHYSKKNHTKKNHTKKNHTKKYRQKYR